MSTITKINDNLEVKEIISNGKSIIYILDYDKQILLSNSRTTKFFITKFTYDKNYIVSYSRHAINSSLPLTIEGAYSITNKKILNLSNAKIKVLLEYMLLTKKEFGLANVLSEINNNDLGILYDEEKQELSSYLTSGNSDISKEDVVNYILNMYPNLKKYTEIKDKLTILDYRKIKEEINEQKFLFNSIPQELTFLDKQYQLKLYK